MTKKILAVLLALTMLFAFAACGSSDKEDLTNKDIIGDVDSEKDNTNDDNDTNSSEDETENDNNLADQQASISVGLGQSTTKQWQNKALGLGYNIPAGYTVLTQDEISQTFSNAVPAGDDLTTALSASGKAYYDFVIQNEDGCSIAVAFMKNPTKITDDIIQSTVDGVGDALESQFKKMGATVKDVSKITKKLGSGSYKGVSVDMTYMGVKMQQAQFYTGAGNYFAFIIVTTTGDTTVEGLIANFYDL